MVMSIVYMLLAIFSTPNEISLPSDQKHCPARPEHKRDIQLTYSIKKQQALRLAVSNIYVPVLIAKDPERPASIAPSASQGSPRRSQ